MSADVSASKQRGDILQSSNDTGDEARSTEIMTESTQRWSVYLSI